MPLGAGFVAAILTVAALRFAAPWLFTGGGVILVLFAAHAAGTIVADLVQQGTSSIRRSVMLMPAATVYLLAAFATFNVMAYLAAGLYASRWGLAAAVGTAHMAGTVAAGCIQPAWRSHTAALLAFVVFGLGLIYLEVASTASQGGPNILR